MSKKFWWVSDRYGVVVTIVDERKVSNAFLFPHRDDGPVVALMLKHGADDKTINSYLIDRKSDTRWWFTAAELQNRYSERIKYE